MPSSPPTVSRFQRLSYIWGDFVRRNAGAIVLVCLLSALPALPFLKSLEIAPGTDALLPRDNPQGRELAEVANRVGIGGNLVAVIEGGSETQRKNFVERYANRLKRERQELLNNGDEYFLQYIGYRLPIAFFSSRRLLYLSESDLIDIKNRLEKRLEQERLKANPFYIDIDDEPVDEVDISFEDLKKKYGVEHFKEYSSSPDDEILTMVFKPSRPAGDPQFSARLIDWLDGHAATLLKQPEFSGVKFMLGGAYKYAWTQRLAMVRNAWISFALLIAVFAVIILLTFKSLRLLLLTFSSLALGLIWTLALASFTYGQLNMITLFLLPPLMGMGAVYAVQMLLRYVEKRRQNFSPEEALANTISSTGHATDIGAAATAAALFSLALIDFRAFHEYGILAGLGVLAQLTAMTVFLPAMLLVMERFRVMVIPGKPAGIPVNPARRFPYPYHLVGGGAFLALAGMIIVTQSLLCNSQKCNISETSEITENGENCCTPLLAMESNLTKMGLRDDKEREIEEKFHRAVPLSLNPASAIMKNRREVLNLERIFAKKKAAGELQSIASLNTIYKFLPTEQESKLRIMADIDLIREKNDLSFLSKSARDSIDEMRHLLHPKPISLYQLPVDILRLFSEYSKETDGLLPLLTRVIDDLPDDTPEKEWLMQCKLGLSGLPLDTIERELKRTAGSAVADFEESEIENWTLEEKIEKLSQVMRRYHEEFVGTVAMAYPESEDWAASTLKKFADDLNTLKLRDKPVTFWGETILFAQIFDRVKRSWPLAFATAIFSALLILAIALRRPGAVIASTLPLIIVQLWMAALIFILQFEINVFNILAMPPLVGIALDTSLRITMRAYEEGRGGVIKAMVKVTPGMILSILLLTLGFLRMSFMQHAGIASLGRLSAAGILLVGIADFIFLLPLLEILDRRRIQ